MARLASQQKMGYYKTPPHLISTIASYITPQNPEETILLDTCCGTGEAIQLLGQELNTPAVKIFGNELDASRFQEASGLLGNKQVTFGDALGEFMGTVGRVSVLYENPPYDDEGNFEGRTEFKFLRYHNRYLKKNGILVFLVPLSVLSKPEAESLPVWYKDIRVFKFPEEDFKAFGQVVLIARKFNAKTKAELDNFKEQVNNPLTLGDPCDIRYVAPASEGFTAASRNLHQDQVSSLIPLIQKELSVGLNQHVQDSRIQSLTTLRAGHQALLLGSGGVNGAYRDPDNGNLLIVKGDVKTITEMVDVSEGEVEKTKETTRSIATIKAFDVSETLNSKQEVVLYEYR